MIFKPEQKHIVSTIMLLAVAALPLQPLTTTGAYADTETSVGNIFRAGVWGGTTPDPDPEISTVPGNPSCASLGYPEEAKIEPIPEGLVVLPLVIPGVGTVTVTVTEVNEDDEGITFDWSADFGIDAVIAKGGPNANLYIYDPPAEAFSDSGLQPPLGAGSDGAQPFGISHVSFCYDLDPAPAVLSAFSVEVSEEPLEVEKEEPSPEESLPEVEVSDGPAPTLKEVGRPTENVGLEVETSDEPLEVVEPTPEKEEAPEPQEETPAPEETPAE